MVDAVQLRDAEMRGLEQGRELGLEQGRELGRELGLEQGREYGRRAMQQMVLRQLARRLGSVPDRLRNQLEALDQEFLDAFSVELLDFASFADVDRWLTQH